MTERYCGCSFGNRMLAVAATLMAAAAFGAGEAVFEGGVLTFDVDASAYPESAPYDYGQDLPSGITGIVKRGTGSVTLGDRSNTTFKGTVSVEANGGYLMGPTSAFGAPSEITVNAGGAVEFTETATQGNMAATHFKIAGGGPDGKGALLRPCVGVGSRTDFFKKVTLLADATINVGSRWGITSGTLDMGNHRLTLRNDRHVSSGWSHEWVCLDVRNTLTVKDPGEIFIQSGALNFEGSTSRLADAADSNGTISNMTITVSGNSTSAVRIFATSKGAVPCPLVSLGSPQLRTYTESPASDLRKYSNWDGPVTVGTNSLNLVQYEASERGNFVFNREVSGPGKLLHDARGYLFFTGCSTNTLGGFSQGSSGTTHVGDDVYLNVTGAVVNISGGTAASPATLVLDDRSGIVEIPTPSDRNSRAGYRIATEGNYGLLKICGGAVVSNDVTFGYKGYGACYQFGGYLRMMHGRDGNNVTFIGHNSKSYGYLGIDGGTFEQDHWFYLGTYSPGFLIQRGGTANQGKNTSGAPMRIANSGTESYGYYAVLGGKAVWRGYAALNFCNYGPVAKDSTATFTVDGATAEVDMSNSNSNIRSVPTTNGSHAVTAFVNLGHGGRLKVRYIAVEQIYNGSATPNWDTIKELIPAGTKTYLNFNGGTLVAARTGEFFCNSSGVGNDPYRLPTRTTVYDGGLTVDTDGKNVTWRAPLLRPYGYGLKSVTLPEEAVATNALLGPTRCRIVSAQGGAGADALMDFDDTNRVARGMIVTSPGFGYEAAPAVTVQKPGSDSASVWQCTVETVNYDAENFAHGGLTKTGSGTLTLACTNTYGGATRCAGGTLEFTDAEGMPAGGTVEFPAATLMGLGANASPLLVAHTLRASKIRITEADTLDSDAWRGVRNLGTFTTALQSLPTVEFVKGDGTVCDRQGWKAYLRNDGKTLSFAYFRGMVLLLR